MRSVELLGILKLVFGDGVGVLVSKAGKAIRAGTDT